MAKIKLYGHVGQWYEISHKAVSQVLSGLTDKVLDVHVHTPGGEVFEGWLIFNLFQQAAADGLQINFYVDGIAASMGSFLIQAGHKVYMAENSMLMVHAPSGGAWGNASKMKEAHDLLTKIQTLMVKEYQRRSQADPKTVSKWMEGDNWFTPEEALKAGLIDGVVPAVATRRMEVKDLEPRQAYEAYALALNTDVNMDKIITALGLDPTADQDQAVIKITALTTALQNAQTALETQKQKHTTELAAALVDAAVAANKIAPGDKDKYLKLAAADYETTRSLLTDMKPITSISSQLQGQSQATDLAAEWDRLHKSGELEGIRNSNPARYQELFKAKYPQA